MKEFKNLFQSMDSEFGQFWNKYQICVKFDEIKSVAQMGNLEFSQSSSRLTLAFSNTIVNFVVGATTDA